MNVYLKETQQHQWLAFDLGQLLNYYRFLFPFKFDLEPIVDHVIVLYMNV